MTLASLTRDAIMGTVHDEPGKSIKPDLTIDEATPEDYDALLLPGRGWQPRQAADG